MDGHADTPVTVELFDIASLVQNLKTTHGSITDRRLERPINKKIKEGYPILLTGNIYYVLSDNVYQERITLATIDVVVGHSTVFGEDIRYERVILNVKNPISSKNTIPHNYKSSIPISRIIVTSESSLVCDATYNRKDYLPLSDYLPIYGLFQKRTDLTDLIPYNWFGKDVKPLQKGVVMLSR